MKPQQFSVEGSLGKEPKRTFTFRERLRQACEAALVSKSGVYDVVDQNGRRSNNLERRRWSNRAEDPIRTLMFLGSWSHT